MKKIILFTNMSSIRKHWERALLDSYQPIHIEKFSELISYLDKNSVPAILMFDEMSVSDIQNSLLILKSYTFATILLFNAMPEVHHASTLLTEGIRGYENSYIDKNNLLKMLNSVEGGNNWLFSNLTRYIINKYIKSNSKNQPDFMPLLTEREKDIALMIADGLSNKEIAQKEKLALSTVKGHVSHIFEKAGVTDRIALALKFK
ncbi:MAG: helix-turn-helix transcriptional regulator [Sulfurimonas sp. RIFCSPLOWO2_12_FULL_36_74]|uniref:response regulator transcription factor n=1 Tax=Sulfurimonas sp. RIFCSPLOWO2_12_36_12 TaxID=1802253 RepID=UPI0008B6DAC0|nr:LuxR C-terminal-related transcriptional regulator [Sulfurimonas sp. RIFCSPLOWO2_12_36_12]OHD98594.1 MAG: helix-turn-helix transcriptional regulator [Sulfurimonas sp. RIFCSPLOWO2_02_FULL_36_28]OHE02613.1 MAG: helix-turn-helix transcriptional regulator [Sulfurimonas sp. RIFCSPLOWO2_12_36_12]OHE06340.1 MAG: helix-turn-helix transcriptional regulator [Sulfurimonas sp. RIFCSPLOWO2_12_FULL_36_74]